MNTKYIKRTCWALQFVQMCSKHQFERERELTHIYIVLVLDWVSIHSFDSIHESVTVPGT